jgi:hypothetical protein
MKAAAIDHCKQKTGVIAEVTLSMYGEQRDESQRFKQI